jgi:predicted XRE-type DNA-binding protein
MIKTGENMKKEKITASSGNVFLDLGFPAEEATVLAMRSQLMCDLELLITAKGWTQAQAAKHLNIAQSRVSDLVRGKWDKFSLDMLISLASRAGKTVTLEMV